MIFFPFRIDCLFKQWPVVNWLIMLVTATVFFLQFSMSEETLAGMILDGWEPSGMLGHMLLHAGIIHLAGNLVFLWVFGNTVCGNISNWVYPFLYFGFGLAAAAVHNLFDGGLAIGASGAINGVVGMAFAMYPLDGVGVFYWFFFRFGTFRIPLWVLVIVWTIFDLWGAVSGSGGVAYWAHLGGLAAGILTGLFALKFHWLTLNRLDHESLLELLKLGKVERE